MNLSKALFGTKRAPSKMITVSLNETGLTPEQASRLHFAMSYFEEPLEQIEQWVHKSREPANFTYDLGHTNKQTLASLLSLIAGVSYNQVWLYMMELDQNDHLKRVIIDRAKSESFMDLHDPTAFFGRRIGWYAMVRILKPKVVVETGVDKGLGAMALCAALLRNGQEGFSGKYFGTDIMPAAGYLLTEPYSSVGEILYGDSIETLSRFERPIDLFINDSDHSAGYETMEYDTILPLLTERAVILGDNGPKNLFAWSEKVGRSFAFFKEAPLNHWHPGAGIAFSYPSLS